MPDVVDRLETWAAIAAHLGRDVRTAKRYEVERRLPVHRLPGDGTSTVYAFRSELDAWLQNGRPGPPAAVDPVPPPIEVTAAAGRPTRRSVVSFATATACACVLVLLAGFSWVTLGAQARSPASPAEARAFTQQGVYAWNRRTPEGLAQAVDAFTQAVVLDPKNTAAYVGLADCYNLGPEFGRMRPAEAYPRARAAALRALALEPNSAEAHRALGFVDFWWRQDVARGLAEMREAARLAPRSAQTHHWLANMLAARGDLTALKEIDEAFSLAPDTPVLADRGYALVMLGRYDEARAVLLRVTQLQPDYAPAHQYLRMLAHRLGDEAAALRERRLVAEMSHDPAAVSAAAQVEATLVRRGPQAAMEEVAEQQERMLAAGGADSFEAASAVSHLRRRAATLAWLVRARAEHQAALLSLPTNPDFAWLRSDPAFRRLIG